MILPTSATLSERLRLPVEVIDVDGLPKVMAGGLPVTPINVALKWKSENRVTTKASLGVYVRASRLHVEFAAHRGRALFDITNEEFHGFTQALQGRPFLDANGHQVFLGGSRGPRTADLMVVALYSLAADLQEIYQTRFDWYKFRGAPVELVEYVRALGGKQRSGLFRRLHRVPYTPRKVRGVPDGEFERLVRAAYDKWGGDYC